MIPDSMGVSSFVSFKPPPQKGVYGSLRPKKGPRRKTNKKTNKSEQHKQSARQINKRYPKRASRLSPARAHWDRSWPSWRSCGPRTRRFWGIPCSASTRPRGAGAVWMPMGLRWRERNRCVGHFKVGLGTLFGLLLKLLGLFANGASRRRGRVVNYPPKRAWSSAWRLFGPTPKKRPATPWRFGSS